MGSGAQDHAQDRRLGPASSGTLHARSSFFFFVFVLCFCFFLHLFCIFFLYFGNQLTVAGAMQDEYALFTADGKCLKEDDLLATHAPSIAVLSLSLSIASPVPVWNRRCWCLTAVLSADETRVSANAPATEGSQSAPPARRQHLRRQKGYTARALPDIDHSSLAHTCNS